jgi:MFS family permease
MGTIISTSLIGGLALCIALWMMWRKKSKKLTSWIMLVSGLFLNGLLAGVVNSIVSTIRGTAGNTVGGFIGLSASGVMFIIGVIVVLELWHGIHPKKGRPDSWHPWLALAAPVLLIAAGGVFATAIHAMTTTATTVGVHTAGLLG